MSCDNPHNGICRQDIPYPQVSPESVPSLIDNLVTALYGSFYNPQTGTGFITKSVVNGRIVWNITCDPNNTAIIAGVPRGDGEGLLCYLIRVLEIFNPTQYASLTGPQTITDTTFVNAILNSPLINSPIGLTKSDVGLDQVDNTADINKPVSGPQQSYIVNEIAAAFAVFVPTTVQNLFGGTAYQIPYQTAPSTTDFLPNGAAGLVLTANGPGLPPSWQVNASTATNADNITGGTAGDLLYQSAPGTTAKLTAGTNNFVLKSNGPGNAPSWVQKAPEAVAADTAGVSTNIAGGANGSIPYQTGAGATAFLAAGPAGTLLQTGTPPTWQATDAATASANSVVKRDASGNIIANTFNGNLSGNATTATGLTPVPGLVAGTYGSSSVFPVVTVNTGGQVTAISTLPNPSKAIAAILPQDDYGDTGHAALSGLTASGGTAFLDNQGQLRVSGGSLLAQPFFGLGADSINCTGPGYPVVNVNYLTNEFPVKLFVGPLNMYILTNLGNIYAAGQNEYGQCGVGGTAAVPFFQRITGITDVAEFAINQGIGGTTTTGGQFCLAARSDGTLWGWGQNTQGQLGINNTTNQLVPVQVTAGPMSGRFIRKVYCFGSVGCSFSMVIDNNDFVFGAGQNVHGQLGINNNTNTPIFVQAHTNYQADFLIGVGGISAANNRGSVWGVRNGIISGTGSNSQGELGLGNQTDRNQFTQVLAVSGIAQLTCSSNANNQGASVAAIDNSGVLYVWGNNGQGQLANGSVATQTSPTLPNGVSGVVFVKARFSGAPSQFVTALGGVRLFALDDTGIMRCAGGPGNGFGTGVATTALQQTFVSPLQGQARFINFRTFGGSNQTQNVLAQTAGGELYGWGNNTNFALGIPISTAAGQFIRVPQKIQFL